MDHIALLSLDNIIQIKNYFLNYSLTNNVENNFILTHEEKVNNTWEESSCNDDGDEYDEVAYLERCVF